LLHLLTAIALLSLFASSHPEGRSLIELLRELGQLARPLYLFHLKYSLFLTSLVSQSMIVTLCDNR
jgi:hypothetical protein